MIFLTGDVHGRIKGNWEQRGCLELDSAIKYLDILKKHNISCTFFINGISLKEDWLKVRQFLDYDVELGGHTYDNFGDIGKFKGYFYKKIWKCLYGPPYFQKKDIEKTRKEFENHGLQMKSWRTHAFGSNDVTFKILRKNGVKFVSDFLGIQKPFLKKGIVHLPINIPVDQNTISYGVLRPENRNPAIGCKEGRILPEEWFDILKKRIEENEKKGVDSVLLIHPQTMYALDNFKLFEKMADFLSRYESEKVGGFGEFIS